MAVIETPVLLTSKDKSGNKRLIYPITQADCVDGLEELVDERISIPHFNLAEMGLGDGIEGTAGDMKLRAKQLHC